MTEEEKSKQINKIAQELWIKYEPGIRILCTRKLSGCTQEVDDVVSDVYTALINALHEGRVIRNPAGWLYAVANNLINKKYEELRDKRQRLISVDDLNYCHRLAYEYDFIDMKISDERIELAKQEIQAELTPEENEMLELLYDKKKKQRSVAKRFNVTENALQQKNYRMKHRIKRMAHDKIKDIMNEL